MAFPTLRLTKPHWDHIYRFERSFRVPWSLP
jgi:hypothetical protein